MKRTCKFFAVAIAAIMTIGTVTLVSCDKDDSTITTESQVVSGDVAPATKKKVNVDIDIKDSQGRTWHVKGWVDVSLSGVKAYNIDITDPNGNTTHFEGTVKSLPGGGFNVSGTLTDENGNVIIITKDMEQFLIELTDYVQANY